MMFAACNACPVSHRLRTSIENSRLALSRFSSISSRTVSASSALLRRGIDHSFGKHTNQDPQVAWPVPRSLMGSGASTAPLCGQTPSRHRPSNLKTQHISKRTDPGFDNELPAKSMAATIQGWIT